MNLLKAKVHRNLKYFILIPITFLIVSCQNSRDKSEAEYENCINNKTFNRGIFYAVGSSDSDIANSISVFDSINKFENDMHDNGFLNSFSKKDYLSLVSKIDQKDFLKKEFIEFNSKNYFIKNNLMTINFFEEMFYDCVMSSFKNQIEYQFILTTKDNVQLNSYPNSEILTELIDEVDFQSTTQRSILTYLIYCNLYSKYEME